MSDFSPAPSERPDYRRELELARFSRLSYLDPASVIDSDRRINPDYEHLLDHGLGLNRWEYIRTVDSNAASGFVAHVFIQHEPDKRMVLAIRGSDNPVDWSGPNAAVARDGDLLDLMNLPSPVTKQTRAQMLRLQEAILPGDAWHPQFRDALDFALELQQTYGTQGYRMMVAGHSGGGAQGQVIAHTFGWDGRSFDAPGAANIVQSRGYREWLAGHGLQPVGVPPYTSDPFASGFLNYKVNNSVVAYKTGPHLGDAQSISSFVGREGFGPNARYAAGLLGGGISETPLLGPVLKATGAGRLATVVGTAAHGTQHGVDALDRHDIHRVVAVFEEAVRRQDRGDRQPLPVYGEQGTHEAVPVAAAGTGDGGRGLAMPSTSAPPMAQSCDPPGQGAMARFFDASLRGQRGAFHDAARELCATPEAMAWLDSGRAQLQAVRPEVVVAQADPAPRQVAPEDPAAMR